MSATNAKAAGKTVLLVDDDADFVAMNKAVLEQAGYAVLVAYNAEECQDKARAGKPDLVVLDVMMRTATEGFHLAYALRHAPETKDTPLLMVSSVNQTVPYKFEPDPNWLPVDQFIEKPITPRRLLEEVGKRLAAAKA